MRNITVSLIGMLFFPLVSEASQIETCSISGEVIQLTSKPSPPNTHTATLNVKEAQRLKSERSYSKCLSYIGSEMQFDYDSKQHSILRGDIVELNHAHENNENGIVTAGWKIVQVGPSDAKEAEDNSFRLPWLKNEHIF